MEKAIALTVDNLRGQPDFFPIEFYNLIASTYRIGGHVLVDPATLFTYLAVVLGFVFIPGPAVLMTLTRAASSGMSVGIATGFGIAIGDLIHTAMIVFGFSAIIVKSLLLFSLVKYLGAAYLIYLGYKAITDKSEIYGLPQQAKITPFYALKQGVVAEVLNPKSALFFLSFLPQFVDPVSGAISGKLSTLSSQSRTCSQLIG